MLGVAYKANVSDIRESPALDVIRLLAAKGAQVTYHDPHVAEVDLDGWTAKSIDLTDDALAAADLVVILTSHARWTTSGWSRRRSGSTTRATRPGT